MDFDLTWLLWGLPLAFALGWAASRLDLRQWRMESRQAPKAYFRGLNHLLNEQQDQAIDAFIEAVQGDPDTAELHFALGNLFRRRGDYDRAVRVHEHLLSRADLSGKDRDRAQHALALDFLKAGLLDRAEAALQKLQGTSFAGEAMLALLGIYERSRDWPRALEVALKLDAQAQGSFASRLAHYRCEQAQQFEVEGSVIEHVLQSCRDIELGDRREPGECGGVERSLRWPGGSAFRMRGCAGAGRSGREPARHLLADDAGRVRIVLGAAHPANGPLVDQFDVERAGRRTIVRADGAADTGRHRSIHRAGLAQPRRGENAPIGW